MKIPRTRKGKQREAKQFIKKLEKYLKLREKRLSNTN